MMRTLRLIQRSSLLWLCACIVAATVVSWHKMPWGKIAVAHPIRKTIKLDTDEWDFGVVDSQQPSLVHTFQLTNLSAAPIKVAPSYLGCNCLSIECPDEVATNASVPVRVEIEVRRREGPFSSRISLRTTARDTPEVELRVAFYGDPGIDVDPPSIQIAGASRDEILTRELTIVTRSATVEPAEPPIVDVSPSAGSAVSAEHIETRMTAGLLGSRGGEGLKRFVHRFVVTIDPRQLPKEPDVALHDGLRVCAKRGDRDVMKSIPIIISFKRHSCLSGPAQLTVRSGKSVIVPLHCRDGRAFRILRVESSLPQVVPALGEAGDQESTNQRFTITAEKRSPPPSAGIIHADLAVFCSLCPDEPYRVEALVLP